MSTEQELVRQLGDRIGYGRVMQLAEETWNIKSPGAAHSVGPCVAFLVTCPCPEAARGPVDCAWCCGSGRVTRRVLDAIEVVKTAIKVDAEDGMRDSKSVYALRAALRKVQQQP